MSRLVWVVWFACISGTMTVHAQAESPADRPGDTDDAGFRSGPNREGEYSGVTPGRARTRKGRVPRKRKNAISWIGFQPREDGGARIFVQMANELAFEQTVDSGVLVVKIEKARYRYRNTRRRLDVRYFDTPLSLITSKRVSRRRARKHTPGRKAGVELSIRFKTAENATTATASLRAEKDGYTYLYLDIPPATGSVLTP